MFLSVFSQPTMSSDQEMQPAIFDRVFNSISRARQQLSANNNNNLLTSTRRLFRRQVMTPSTAIPQNSQQPSNTTALDETSFNAETTESVNLHEWRAIRSQQDEEYNASLLADIEKDRRRHCYEVLEEKRKKAIEERRQRIAIRVEPLDGEFLKVKYPKGDLIKRKFIMADLIQVLFVFIGQDEMASEVFRIQEATSSNAIESTSTGSISDHGIKPFSTLYILWTSPLDNLGHEKDRSLALDIQALETTLYASVGKMIALCVTHGGVGPHFFSERLFQQICGVPTSPASEATTVLEANCAITEAADSLSIIGALIYTSSLTGRNSLVQFSEGLQTLGLLEEMQKYPFLCELLPTREQQKGKGKPDCMPLGESDAVTLERIMEFATGASTVPPLGFPHRPESFQRLILASLYYDCQYTKNMKCSRPT
ncbi:G2/M phase-specific E3 ubiquitin-protein ligase [Labeo rohita]|uniref:G2/M phase-specific E3 ubiquitin-protein ligase n=1 Tax=Labeo rohita TaxID=84645 RepID=A0ABQ8LK96_LABRO|nr:G2/M phase-specific E3 ubiquitin-protein ligase [Labeo rohita]